MNRRVSFIGGLSLLLIVLVVISALVMAAYHAQPKQPSHEAAKQTAPSPPPPPPFEFPAGGRTLAGQYRFLALYGSVETPLLGVLGEQSPAASVTRVKKLAAKYTPLTKQHIYPTFEIIASVAAGSPTDDGDYSHQTDAKKLRPWIDAAKKAGIYVLLDLQPGRSNFLNQAKQYESLLREPHVGLALDPEWRLGPHELPLEQIGHASAIEINATSAWLSTMTKQNDLPQKLFLIHQFQLATLPDRSKLKPHDNLMTVVQMDGQGDQPTKAETWTAVTKNAPTDVVFGWKNFYDEDSPTLTPGKTMTITPQPWYVSYQ